MKDCSVCLNKGFIYTNATGTEKRDCPNCKVNRVERWDTEGIQSAIEASTAGDMLYDHVFSLYAEIDALRIGTTELEPWATAWMLSVRGKRLKS